MAVKVNLSLKPYNLNESQIKLVTNLVLNMPLKDKFRQLFFLLTNKKDEDYLKEEMHKVACGGVRYNPGCFKDVKNHNFYVQKYSKIPCFIAANCESGGNGAFKEGTFIGEEVKIAATRNLNYAYELGNISAKEAKTAGVNTIFAPIVDIHHDFHNPIISRRTFGNDPKLVKAMSLKFMEGIHDNGLLACAKHFPGDGFDERDQHLAPSINPLSQKEWDESFGDVYKAMIDNGVDFIMAGHIQLPSYQNKDLHLPATLSHELITDLLKEKLGFNGVVVTDATHMTALACAGKRSEILPNIIKSGCDMILFYNDFDEDIKFIEDGYKNGIITEERLNDAITRILGLKAKLGLLENDLNDYFPIKDEPLMLENHQLVADKVSDDSITLVKNIDNIIPINNVKHKRVLIVPQEDENPFSAFLPKNIRTIYDDIADMLREKGFEVTIFESLMDKAKKLPPQEALKIVCNVYNNKTPISQLTENYDLVIQFAHIDPHNTVQRITWKLSKGTADVPWYVHELPVIFVSLCSPFHLFDVPQVKTYINCYDKNKSTLKHLVNKLLGESEFKGVSPVDAFCGHEDLKY